MAVETTSGTYVYSRSATQIVSRAYRQMGVIASGETPSSDMLSDAVEALNALIKAWQASQIHVWCEEECILFLQPSQVQYKLGQGSTDNACLFSDLTMTSLATLAAAYATSVVVSSAAGLAVGDNFCVQLDAGTNYWTTISAIAGTTITIAGLLPSQASSGALVFDYTTPLMRPLRVPFGRSYIYSSQITTQMLTLARFDYDILPNQNNTGISTQYFFDPQTGKGAYTNEIALMNVWPAPADNTRGMRFVAQRPLQDITSVANLPDFPAEWINALTWNLGLEMAPEFDVPAERAAVLEKRAQYWLLMAQAWDKEPESVLFGFASQPGYRT